MQCKTLRPVVRQQRGVMFPVTIWQDFIVPGYLIFTLSITTEPKPSVTVPCSRVLLLTAL